MGPLRGSCFTKSELGKEVYTLAFELDKVDMENLSVIITVCDCSQIGIILSIWDRVYGMWSILPILLVATCPRNSAL